MDPFDTATLRSRVLAAWADSPARFREDANAEDELARGAYRDRVVVELAQNAADAGARGDAPAKLLLRLDGTTFVAANTGTPLDSAGVEGLSTLRASTKREQATVGRFGVGFAAVLAVSDEPTVVTAAGGVRWSTRDAVAAAATVPELAAELEVRGEAVPVLRLPFDAGDVSVTDVAAGYDTAVALPLRDDVAVRLVRRLLDEVDDALLLALPDLGEVVVDVDGERRTLRAAPPVELRELDGGRASLVERRIGERTWRLCTWTGEASAELLAGRPFEERIRPGWSVSVAVPVDAAGLPGAVPEPAAGVVHAPTPTDDRTGLPALVVASLPLDSSRRRVAGGPLTDHLAERIGQAYAALVASLTAPAPGRDTADPSVLTLVPGPLGIDELDTVLHRSVRAALAETPFVPGADGGRLRPVDTVVIDGAGGAADPDALAAVMHGVPAPGWWRGDVLGGLGATVRPLSDVVDELAGLRLGPSGWRALYAALDGADREALGTLPVPLADGRVVRGPRGLLLPGEVSADLMAPFELRVVAPEAAHPLLRRLGAVEASAVSVLRDPWVRAAAADVSEAGDDPRPVAEAVLALVAEAGITVEDEPWLADLALWDETGAAVAAGELLLPGSPVLAVLDGDPAEYTVAAELADRFGAETLSAVGVRAGFDVVHDADVPLDAGLWHDLDDEDGWAEAVSDQLDDAVPPVVTEFTGVRDLDLVRGDSWTQVLTELAADQATHAAVVEPALLLRGDGARVPAPSYTAWWLRTHARIDGLRLTQLCTPDADPAVRAVLSVADVRVDETFGAAAGLVRTPADADAGVLLERLAEPELLLGAPQLARLYDELAERDPTAVEPPTSVRVPDGAGSRVVPAEDAVVCDAPYWLQLDLPGALPGPPALAEVLDVDLASDVLERRITSEGRRRDVPDLVRGVLPDAPQSYVEHDDLRAGDVAVAWWIEGGVVHACTLDGLGRGLAWTAGAWDRRWLVSEVLRDPASATELINEDSFR